MAQTTGHGSETGVILVQALPCSAPPSTTQLPPPSVPPTSPLTNLSSSGNSSPPTSPQSSSLLSLSPLPAAPRNTFGPLYPFFPPAPPYNGPTVPLCNNVDKLQTNSSTSTIHPSLPSGSLTSSCSHGSPELEGPSAPSHFLAPLRDVAGVNGVVSVYLPFPMTKPTHLKVRLGSFTSNPYHFIQEFQFITMSYQLTWHDAFVILANILTSDQCKRVWERAKEAADQFYTSNNEHPIGDTVFPNSQPNWNYNDNAGRKSRDIFITCILCRFRASPKRLSITINYGKSYKLSLRILQLSSNALPRLLLSILT
ncbi:uncharacterized protein LOC128585710 [Nycticebus coucang]|uniref:uncharacterized protein LOC128585710 n=1 Tax=Nycticebus coucang TaxID=9470 RepID=UPI00234CC526|nr:uncharacterized protein LOC128585710 [Nycticebus coucang]XP_053446874.1 uncharacterized protein LOC128585710 [Nycticebus coucang]XP_053446875.1 uncharacterized protein LOC128585710 [Nycticebus coucang]XP_053446876.1 uncharacterized protein LOC128585710 [Nycticebus coucang]